MRKPRDLDAELKSLADRQRLLKLKKIAQLGELVVATGADALDAEILAGVLLDAVGRNARDPAREAWRASGAAFFRSERRQGRSASGGAGGDGSGGAQDGGGS